MDTTHNIDCDVFGNSRTKKQLTAKHQEKFLSVQLVESWPNLLHHALGMTFQCYLKVLTLSSSSANSEPTRHGFARQVVKHSPAPYKR